MKHHTISGAGEVPIHVVEAGNAGGRAIVLIHGWSQSHFCWHRQLEDPALLQRYRLIALDLRGHGDSGKPETGYDDSTLWAGDIASLIATLGISKPILAGWSYGGYVLCDYLRHYGAANVGGVHFVDASTDIGEPTAYRPKRAAGWDGLFPAKDGTRPNVYSPDAESAVIAMREFLRRCIDTPLPYMESLALLATNLQTPPAIRQALFARKSANDDILRELRLPVLVAHGENDVIIDVATAHHIVSTVPRAALSLYAACGHAPFLEHTERFNRELIAFAETAV